MVIILNKTGPIGKNGDSMILASIMGESASKKLDNWTYPNTKVYSMASSNYKSNEPEIIELCSKSIYDQCSESSCVLMIGVLGLTPNVTSNFRLMVHNQKTKIYDRTPVRGFIPNVG
jgi:hypothetical protein